MKTDTSIRDRALQSVVDFATERSSELSRKAQREANLHMNHIRAELFRGIVHGHPLYWVAHVVGNTLDWDYSDGVPIVTLPVDTRQILIAAHYAGMIKDFTVGGISWADASFIGMIDNTPVRQSHLEASVAYLEYDAAQTVFDLVPVKI